MTTALVISILLNLVLVRVGWMMFQRLQATERTEERHRMDEQICSLVTDGHRVRDKAIAISVAETMRAIRADIDRNYQHVHDGYFLGRIAHEFEKMRGPVKLDSDLLIEVRKAGGDKFVKDGVLDFDGALELSWHVHSTAVSSASSVFQVVQESCGKTDRAAWLAKTLALYERICDGNKKEAIRSLSVVIEHWKYDAAEFAARSSASLTD